MTGGKRNEQWSFSAEAASSSMGACYMVRHAVPGIVVISGTRASSCSDLWHQRQNLEGSPDLQHPRQDLECCNRVAAEKGS